MKLIFTFIFIFLFLVCKADETYIQSKEIKLKGLSLEDLNLKIENVIYENDTYWVSAWDQVYNKQTGQYDSKKALFIKLDKDLNILSTTILPNEFNGKPITHLHIFKTKDHFVSVFSQYSKLVKSIKYYKVEITNMVYGSNSELFADFKLDSPSDKEGISFDISERDSFFVLEYFKKDIVDSKHKNSITGILVNIGSFKIQQYSFKDMPYKYAVDKPIVTDKGNIVKIFEQPYRLIGDLNSIDPRNNKINLNELFERSGRMQFMCIDAELNNYNIYDISDAKPLREFIYDIDIHGALNCFYSTKDNEDSSNIIVHHKKYDLKSGKLKDSSNCKFSKLLIHEMETYDNFSNNFSYELTQAIEIAAGEYYLLIERKVQKIEPNFSGTTFNSKNYNYYGNGILIDANNNKRQFKSKKLLYQTKSGSGTAKNGFVTFDNGKFNYILLGNTSYLNINENVLSDTSSVKGKNILSYKRILEESGLTAYRQGNIVLYMEYRDKKVIFTRYLFSELE